MLVATIVATLVDHVVFNAGISADARCPSDGASMLVSLHVMQSMAFSETGSISTSVALGSAHIVFCAREVFACGFQSLITGNINNEAYITLWLNTCNNGIHAEIQNIAPNVHIQACVSNNNGRFYTCGSNSYELLPGGTANSPEIIPYVGNASIAEGIVDQTVKGAVSA